ncbi:phosphoribosylamine--glycine ligase [Escherichia coli]
MAQPPPPPSWKAPRPLHQDFLARHAIPTADYQNFTEVEPALAYLREKGAPIVIKADGLAAAKGVIVAMTLQEAEDAVRDMLSGNAFGDAGARVVIEEFLDGKKRASSSWWMASMCCPWPPVRITSGSAMATQAPHRRHGRLLPAPVVADAVHNKVMEQVIMPTVRGMAAEGKVYTGFLYAGLMIDDQGNPKVIEFNCRFGDPETQPIMLRMQSDLVELCLAACEGKLGSERGHL